MTNLINEVRSKIADSKEILIIESDGEEVVNSYTCSVNIVPEIPIEDTIPETLGEMLENIKEAFGDEGCAALARKFAKPAEKQDAEQKEIKSPEDKAKSEALENFLNNVPDNVVPEDEKKYTTKDLDDFLENFMKNHHS